MNDELLADLNEQQQDAVKTIHGPVVIIAGPGTGKTKTLATRIAYLIQIHQVAPEQILALTFTRKAATEMRERVGKMTFHKRGARPFISTFHGLSAHILGDDLSQLKLLTETEQSLIIDEILATDADLKAQHASAREALLHISLQKSRADQGTESDELMHRYTEVLTHNQQIDYDDLLVHLLAKISANDSAARFAWQYILVDEFQDTNPIQYAILKRLLSKEGNLFIIGDPQQSIYSFRGADAHIFDQFLADFPEAKQITLETNYRSASLLVNLSNALFPSAVRLRSSRVENGEATILETLNASSEADLIVQLISERVGGIDLLQTVELGGRETADLTFNHFAVMYRTHFLKERTEQALERSGIPYQVIGGDSLFELPVIKRLITLLQAIDKNDFPSVPVSHILAECIVANQLREEMAEQPRALRALDQFELLAQGYDVYQDGHTRFLHYLNELEQNEFYDPVADKVTLMTIHAAKGLEFDHVFIIGFEEGTIPMLQVEDLVRIEEEKRLLYVAITRAKNALYLFQARKRFKQERQSSRFRSMLDSAGISYMLDPNLERIEKRLAKDRIKKSQLHLFG